MSRLRGRTEDGIHVFLGAPYGADTSGKNRFMPPRKPAPWQALATLSNGAASRRNPGLAETITTRARSNGRHSPADGAKTAWCRTSGPRA